MKKFYLISLLFLAACASGPVGNNKVPEPAKSVDTEKYLGKWYEMARYENRFEKGCEGVTAEYSRRDDGLIKVLNTCRDVNGNVTDEAEGKARIVENSDSAKLKVTFFWPFEGDYWVLDRADDYSWSIVGEPSGRYLWILTRKAKPAGSKRDELLGKVAVLGYDTKLIRITKQ